jgi:hypothetical protein
MDSVVRAVARVEPAPPLVPGQVLDLTYELVERIGGGGMGVVFRARDHRLGRDVAVKVMRASAGEAGDHLRRLFEREARATAQLLHPNIVTLHHVGEHAGYPYLVLELLGGETLSARLARRRRLPVGEALVILDAVLSALAFAHERGVLHRDLKPNNVFITGDERIKVLDFGVALTIDTSPGPVTRTAGTPGYMAPEQRDGGAQDARTDVWAAALLLVECLVGRRPEEHEAARIAAGVDAPRAVRHVLERALASDPARRPESAGELRLALALASGRHGSPDVRPRWQRWSRLAAVAAIGAVLGGAAIYTWERGGTPSVHPTPAEISGPWNTGMFGTMVLHVDPDGTAYGVYEWDDGVVEGTYRDGVFEGTWCELPSRRGPDDGGRLRLSFVRGTNRIMADGVWSYGDTQTSWRKDWTGSRLDGAAPSELEQRLQRQLRCPR